MKMPIIFGFISLMALLAILSGCKQDAAGKATGTMLQYPPPPPINVTNATVGNYINANSCNADQVCEMNAATLSNILTAGGVTINGYVISTTAVSPSFLTLTSSAKSVVVDGRLDVKDTLIVNNGVYIDGKAISTVPGSRSALVLTSDVKKVVVGGGLILNSALPNQISDFGVEFTTDSGSLTITPSSGSAKLVADLTLTKAGSPSGVILKTVFDQLVVQASLSRFLGNLAVNTLTGNGTAYVCVNDKGILFRSSKPCA